VHREVINWNPYFRLEFLHWIHVHLEKKLPLLCLQSPAFMITILLDICLPLYRIHTRVYSVRVVTCRPPPSWYIWSSVSAAAGSTAVTDFFLMESRVGRSAIFPKFQGYPETTLPWLHSRKNEKTSRHKISRIRKVGSTGKLAAKHFCTDQVVRYIIVVNQPVLVPPSHSGVFGRSEGPNLSVLLNRFGTCCVTNL
jgi:hypothetical protein